MPPPDVAVPAFAAPTPSCVVSTTADAGGDTADAVGPPPPLPVGAGAAAAPLATVAAVLGTTPPAPTPTPSSEPPSFTGTLLPAAPMVVAMGPRRAGLS